MKLIIVVLQKYHIVMTKKTQTTSALTTAKWLEKYITQPLKDNQVEALYSAYAMENTFGTKIHKQINEFCLFCEKKKIYKGDISINLAHDVGGGLRNDTLMLPRVSRYSEEGVRTLNHKQTGLIENIMINPKKNEWGIEKKN